MTRANFLEFAAEATVVSTSGLFLAWYLWSKLAVLPWVVGML